MHLIKQLGKYTNIAWLYCNNNYLLVYNQYNYYWNLHFVLGIQSDFQLFEFHFCIDKLHSHHI